MHKRLLHTLFIILGFAKSYAQCSIDFIAFPDSIGIYPTISGYSSPTFVDIDNDGDMDAFIGEGAGNINYYQNTGSPISSAFVLQTGGADPFNGVDVGANSAPTFVDIDNDGDMDAFIGAAGGNINYYENIGSMSSPVFTLQTLSADPFNGVNVGQNAVPTFVDIDNDGDMDAFIGEINGVIIYYQNTGNSASPAFVLQTGGADPFNGVYTDLDPAPAFIDIDNDGDMDAFIGTTTGNIFYYQNTGNSSSPVFTLQISSLSGVGASNYCKPSFVDIDNDGDMDVFIGEELGKVLGYSNIETLTLTATITNEIGINDGAVAITTKGGLMPYQYDWDNDGTGDYDDSEDISGLAAGYYTLIAIDSLTCSDTLIVIVNKISAEEVLMPDNGGLYGGGSADLTYSTTHRLFSGMETPAAIFISDDDANTWYQAFNNDSLENTEETKGWSGNATRILTNNNQWVAVQTNHPKNNYSAIVISYANGDTNTYKTAIDQSMLNNFGYASYAASAIALSDYNLVAAMGPCVVKIGSGPINPLTDITNITTAISSLPLTATINSIALANNANAYPFYIAVDEIGNENGYNRKLYKFDGTNYTQISLPSALNGIRSVFTHPTQTTGDTIFITGKDINTTAYKIYKSFDGGQNWTDASYPSANNFLTDVDYSADWNLSASNNIILIIPGNAISKDMGTTWETLGNLQTANVVSPDNVNTIVGSAKTIEVSTTGATGSFTKTTNYGLQALEVHKISRTDNKSVVYIATKTGLGYTTAYLDTTISSGQKWASPYGAFPLISDTINFGAVAIDPTDSLHVIAGCPYGFYVSTTGFNGFSIVSPANFNANTPQVNDIVFINHNTAFAVTGGDSAYDSGKGNIWKTIDGGLNWDSVSPFGFSSGNTIAKGILGADTVIYVGTGLLNVDKGLIWKSVDMGQTWQKMASGPSSMGKESVKNLPINDLAVDLRGKDTLYIAAGYENNYAFVLSFDGAKTINYLNSYSNKTYSSIAINEKNPDTVYISTGREIYLYDLVNNSSRLLYRGLPGEQIPDLVSGSILVGTTTGFYTFHPVFEADSIITQHFENLHENFVMNVYPNPFTDDATIRLTLKEAAHVSIDLYDITGRKIECIYKGKPEKGSVNYQLSAAHLASGTYLVYVKVNDKSSQRLLYHVK